MAPASTSHHTSEALAAIRIDRDAHEVSGIRCAATSPLFVERFVSASFNDDAEISLAVAEIVAALGRPSLIGIISEFPNGTSGPAVGTAEAAERAASANRHAIRYTTTEDTGDIAPAHEVDALIELVEGTGINVSRVESVTTAQYRAVGKRKPRRTINGCTVPSSLFDAEAATPEQLAPLAGAALGLVRSLPAGDLRPDVASTALPPTGVVGLGWSVQPVTVPVAFNPVTTIDPVEMHYTLLAHAISMVALVLAVVVL